MPALFPITVGSRRWIATLVALAAVGALSIDMSLPAQPVLARRFGAGSGTVQLTLSVFLVGFGCAQLVIGYLSDALGRRRVLLAGLALFTVSGIACALAPSIEALIAFRVLQGIGAAAGPVLARAMVRDVQPGAQAARLLSIMLAAVAVAPMIAPSIGGVLLALLGWRAVFAALALGSAGLLALVALTLPETLPVERRSAPSLRGLARGYARFFSTKGTRLPTLVACTAFAGQFAYIAASPFIYLDVFHVSSTVYGLCFAATAVALMGGSLTGARMLRSGRTPDQLIATGAVLLVAGGAFAVLGTRFGVAGVLVPMVIYFFGCGMTSPSATAMAMMPVPEIAGTASAAIGFIITGAGAVSGYETTELGAASFANIVVVMGVVAAALAWTTTISRMRRTGLDRRRAWLPAVR
jgi:DHA1 family bicyclomycin/chloramphenicol resistance-like MFS transporter